MPIKVVPEIENTLKRFVAANEPYVVFDLDLRALAARLNVLPAILDMSGCFALRPDGEVVSFTWDEPSELTAVSKPLLQRMALFQGSLKYPALASLVPTRPPEGITCGSCKGTGTIQELSPSLAASVICNCGGLGWVLPGETNG